MDVNKILSETMARIKGDIVNNDNGDKSLGSLLLITEDNPFKVAKGPRRPASWVNQKCFTAHVLSAPIDQDSKVYTGTLLINFYCPNYSEDNANVELMGPVSDRVVKIFDDQPLEIDGYKNYSLFAEEPLGPLFDPSRNDEHFMSVRIKFTLSRI